PAIRATGPPVAGRPPAASSSSQVSASNAAGVIVIGSSAWTMDAPWYRTSTVSPAAAGNATVAESRSATSTSNGSPVLGTKVSVAGSVDGLSTITVSDSQLKLHSAICRGGGAGVWQSAGMVRSAPA